MGERVGLGFGAAGTGLQIVLAVMQPPVVATVVLAIVGALMIVGGLGYAIRGWWMHHVERYHCPDPAAHRAASTTAPPSAGPKNASTRMRDIGKLRSALRTVRGDIVAARPIVAKAQASGVLWGATARFPRGGAWKKERSFLAHEAPENVYRLTEAAYQHISRLGNRRGGAWLSRRRAVEDDDDLTGAGAALAAAESALDNALSGLDQAEAVGTTPNDRGWVPLDQLDAYLDNINRVMEKHGFPNPQKKNPNEANVRGWRTGGGETG